MNVDMSQLTDEQTTAQIRAWTETAAAMYDELIAKGMVMGVYNYIDIITSGDFGIGKKEETEMKRFLLSLLLLLGGGTFAADAKISGVVESITFKEILSDFAMLGTIISFPFTVVKSISPDANSAYEPGSIDV